MTAPISVFADFEDKVYPFRFRGTLLCETIAGGVPTDPKKAEGWLRSKLTESSDERIQSEVARVMAERGVTMNEAAELVNADRHLNGFKIDPDRGGELYINGYQLKSAIREAANIRWPKERWGPTNKGTMSFWAEHVFIPEARLYLGVKEPSGVAQHFVHTWRGNGIQYTEFIENCEVPFTILCDFDMDREFKGSDHVWEELWVTGQEQGIGASRKLGYGRYKVVRWDLIGSGKVSSPAKKSKAKVEDDGWAEAKL